jgi:hypothetical protein
VPRIASVAGFIVILYNLHEISIRIHAVTTATRPRSICEQAVRGEVKQLAFETAQDSIQQDLRPTLSASIEDLMT